MSGIFPESTDGGLPPNSSDTSNPKAAYPPVTAPLGTAALYYGNGCQVRLRPEVINSLISEIEATVDQAAIAYSPASRENLELAIRYLIQRGLPRGALMTGASNSYVITLDPPATAHNNFMTLTLVPPETNTGPVQLNLQGLGLMPLLRNDGLALKAGDITLGIPFQTSFYIAAWFLTGVAKSQAASTFDLLVAIFDRSGTWTVPFGVTSICIDAWGAGGGGGPGDGVGGLTGLGGGGGGGGEYGMGYFPVTPGEVITLTVGAGGGGSNTVGVAGQNGGQTLVFIPSAGANVLVLNGGGGGQPAFGQGSTPGQGGSLTGGSGELIDGSGGFVPNSIWAGGGTPGGGTSRGRLYAMQGNFGLQPGGGGAGSQTNNLSAFPGAFGRVKITYPQTTTVKALTTNER